MKIAIVGPAHPYKGGIAQHATALAHHLAEKKHEVDIISWKAQYPFFYPGEQFVANDKPEIPLFDHTIRVLSWRNPFGWIKWAFRLRHFDQVIFVWWVPTIQGPVYWLMLRILSYKGPHTLVLCHNIVQHSAGPIDTFLTRLVFDRADRLLVHTKALANIASDISATPISVATMPAHFPGNPKPRKGPFVLHNSLLFFGLVRQYKGVDLLLKALVSVPNIRLVIAGELWGKQAAVLSELVTSLGLEKRVEIKAGYVPAEDIPDLFGECDALVLPYRSGTATQNVEMAFAYGVPVIATKVGSVPESVQHGVDGMLCEPNNIKSLVSAVQQFYKPGVAKTLSKQLPDSTEIVDWQNYTAVVTALPPKL
jgi:glycosyltransferase involved in cell wall biosynthesis